MLEEEGKKEDQFGFTAEGERLGYISLDQARVLAMEHARDNREFYGRRYANRELVWEVASQEESEDYYDIRLSFRPAEGFRGEPGVELFTIDKAGPIRLRQVLQEPRPKTRFWPAYAAAGVLAVAGAVVAGLFAAGVFSPSPAGVVSVPVSPDTPAQLVFADGDVTVGVDAGSVKAPSQLSYRSLSPSEIPVLPAQYKITDTAFDLTMDAALLKPLTVTVRLSAADAVLAGSVEDNIVIQHHRDGTWTPLFTTADFGASTARAKWIA